MMEKEKWRENGEDSPGDKDARDMCFIHKANTLYESISVEEYRHNEVVRSIGGTEKQ